MSIEIEMDDDGYPTEGSLAAIEAWQPAEGTMDYRPLFEAMRAAWRWPSYFPEGTESMTAVGNHRCTTYEVHTGGWSGHESMLAALEANWMVWTLTWLQVRRGGHYVFEVRHRWAEAPTTREDR